MPFRKMAVCTILVLGLARTTAAAQTCDRGACQGEQIQRLAPPLQLDQFMRTPKASRATHKLGKVAIRAGGKHTKKASRTVLARHHKQKMKPTTRPMPVQAAAALAYGAEPHWKSEMAAMTGDQTSDIDRDGDATPDKTIGADASGAGAVQFVQATDYNDIDRMSDDMLPASFVVPMHHATTPEQQPDATPSPSRNSHTALPASTSWSERVWTMLSHVFTAIASGWRHLFG